MSLLRRLARRISPSLYAIGQNLHVLAARHGQLRSMRQGQPVAADGTPLPWYTYPAIEYLSQFDFSQSRIFEFGAGNSSLFWASRAREVVTIESDPSWYERVRASMQANQTLLLRQDRASFVGALGEQRGTFDVIVIDGRWRNQCAALAPGSLAEGGLIILDNSDKFASAAQLLRELGFFESDYSGFGPVNNYAWTTSVFVAANGRLQGGFRNPAPIGGRGVTIVAQDET